MILTIRITSRSIVVAILRPKSYYCSLLHNGNKINCIIPKKKKLKNKIKKQKTKKKLKKKKTVFTRMEDDLRRKIRKEQEEAEDMKKEKAWNLPL